MTIGGKNGGKLPQNVFFFSFQSQRRNWCDFRAWGKERNKPRPNNKSSPPSLAITEKKRGCSEQTDTRKGDDLTRRY